MTKIVESFADALGGKSYNTKDYTTRNFITKYEKTKVVGLRLEQLARGAPTLADTKDANITSLRDLVNLELQQRVLPFVIVRTLPNSKKEYWRLCDLIIPEHF